MTQAEHRERCLFLAKCAAAHSLVQAYLSDTLPQESLAKLDPPYTVRSQRRQVVKEKVKKSLEVLETALENHQYV